MRMTKNQERCKRHDYRYDRPNDDKRKGKIFYSEIHVCKKCGKPTLVE